MATEVELIFTETLNQGIITLYVTIVIYHRHNHQRIRQRTRVSPIPPPLESAFLRWQRSFHALVDPFLMEDDEDVVFSCNCWESYQQLIDSLNHWLNQEPGWLRIQQWLKDYIPPSQREVYLLIQSENQLLKQLPWQDWSFIRDSYPQTEIALSSSEYEIPKAWKGVQTHPKVRILVVLGSNDHVDLQWDEHLFRELKHFGTQIEVLKQPTLEDLQNTLQASGGWHIFFYGGHSETLSDGTGLLWLRNSHPPIQIEQLEHSFKIAINKGLHLGIFNSCNGLGIAQYLTGLRFPQLIVMRELVPNQIAVEFLQEFLFRYSRNHSLIFSIHQAKQSLNQQYHHPDFYPGVHHLPILYCNPALPIPKWKTFQRVNSFSREAILFFSILIIISLSLPLSLWWEFQDFNLLIFYGKLYPHIVIFPVLFLWGFVWCLYKAFCQLVNRKNLKMISLSMLVISCLAVYVEWTAPNMLLFELNQQAETVVSNIPQKTLDKFKFLPANFRDSIVEKQTVKIRQSDLENSLKKLILTDSLSPSERTAYYEYMKLGLNFSVTWSHQKRWMSYSRFFYGLIVFIISFSLLTLIYFWSQLIFVKNINNYITYLGYLSFVELILLLWMPYRLYYNLSVKPLIFGETTIMSNWDSLVYSTLAIILMITISLMFRSQEYLLAFIIIFILFVIILLSINPLNALIDYSFGLNTVHEVTWLLYPIIMFIVLYIWSQIIENWH